MPRVFPRARTRSPRERPETDGMTFVSATGPGEHKLGLSLTEVLGGSWALMYEGDNLVFRSDNRVAKLARHPDGRQRLQTGLTAAVTCAAAGIPVVQPLYPTLVETRDGVVSLWPYVDHRHLKASMLDYEDGFHLGLVLAALAKLPADTSPEWDPLARIPYRLATTEAPPDIVAAVARTVELVQKAVTLEWTDHQFAHGDISATNALFTTAGVVLIDFDSAGRRPLGWDIACLDVHLAREHGNIKAFRGVLDAWTNTIPSSDLQTMAIVKAMMATTYMLTLPPTTARLSSIAERCATVERWITRDGGAERSLVCNH